MEATPRLETLRLLMDPLRVADASEMVDVLSARDLYRFTGGDPPSLRDLESRFRVQVEGPGAENQAWHNWILRIRQTRRAIGYVQATVNGTEADVAWLIGVPFQGRGFASEAALEMCSWLRETGIEVLTAHIHPEHVKSGQVAERIGLRNTGELDDEGEVLWSDSRSDS